PVPTGADQNRGTARLGGRPRVAGVPGAARRGAAVLVHRQHGWRVLRPGELAGIREAAEGGAGPEAARVDGRDLRQAPGHSAGAAGDARAPVEPALAGELSRVRNRIRMYSGFAPASSGACPGPPSPD